MGNNAKMTLSKIRYVKCAKKKLSTIQTATKKNKTRYTNCDKIFFFPTVDV